MKVVYISIGNSDDKLTQAEWAAFYEVVDYVLDKFVRHGEWASFPDSVYQNACWCIEVNEDDEEELKGKLRDLARVWRQDSIAWAEAKTEFLSG